MLSEPSKRKLAAILAADAVGYSRLMSGDDHATVAALDAARDVFKSRIESNQGRVIDMAGDSVLAAFETATGAANAALRVQEDLRNQAATVLQSRQMHYRIGVHLGDVIEKIDGSIYGDGVNIAARLQSLGEPGDVMVSDSVRIAVRGKLPAAFEDQGEQQVKNIPEPVRVYKMRLEVSKGSVAVSGELAIPGNPSIAVLPFNNMSGDVQQDYFADGISEDIITDLSRVSGLLVIARNSSFVFKGQAVDIREVGRRLGVRHVLEGSVRKSGDRVKITAQLIDAQTDGHVWAERFDRDLADVFAVQDEVTRKIVNALRVELTDPERSRLGHRRKVDPAAYDLVMQARRHLHQYTAETIMRARGLLERAARIDPGCAQAYAIMALARVMEFVNGWNDSGPRNLVDAIDLVKKAVAIDPDAALAYQALALVRLWSRDYDAAESAARKSIELGPSYSEGFRALGQILDFTGRRPEAIEAFERALRLNPEQDLNIHLLGRAYLGMGRLAEAEARFKQRLVLSPHSDMTRVYLASIYGRTGRYDLARETWQEMVAMNPHFSTERLKDSLPYQDPAWFEHIADGLRSAGVTFLDSVRTGSGALD